MLKSCHLCRAFISLLQNHVKQQAVATLSPGCDGEKHCTVVMAKQHSGISALITIISSGVLNEVAHSSVAGANHCSLLPD